MSALQLQGLEVLQATSQELQQRVSQAILLNPVLVEVRPSNTVDESELLPNDGPNREAIELDNDAKEYNQDVLQRVVESDFDSYLAERGTASRNFDAEEKRQHLLDSYSRPDGLYGQLERQIQQEYDDQPALKALCKELCGNIDHRGYLQGSEEEWSQQTGASAIEIGEAVAALQRLDPPGIAARNLRECLLLQLERQKLVGSIEWDIVNECLEDVARNRIAQIATRVDADMDEVHDAIQRIKSLDPNPGWQLEFEAAPTISPDVFIEKNPAGGWLVRANKDSVPLLAYDAEYIRMYADPKLDSETRKYLNEKINAAGLLIGAIDQRERTITKAALALLELQPEFFKSGKERDLRPLVLAALAERLELSEGTVSRAISNKYVSTPWGVRSFKSFFSFGYKNDAGEAVSSLKIRELIKAMIAKEDPAKPLSDLTISEKLQQAGYDVKRRTIAKYRDLDNIPASSLRKVVRE